MVGWCDSAWKTVQCRGFLLIWIIVGQEPTALVVGVGGRCLDLFLSSITSLFPSPSLGETEIQSQTLKYSLKD